MKQELQRRALVAYGRAIAVVDPIRLQLWDGRGLTMPQLRLMHLLRLREPRPVGELASEMKVSPASVTGLTDRLVRQELIQRQANACDRRVVDVVLTDEGRRLLDEIEVTGTAYLAPIFERMGDEEVEKLIAAFDGFAAAAGTPPAEPEADG